MAWTPENIKLLKKLWQKGKSAVEIGKELGISKNAVIGKVHRLELDARPSPIKKTTVSNAVTPPEEVIDPNKPVTLLDLRINSCRWPIGELKDEDFHFCGKECQTGKPYCAEHCKIAYTSLKELTLQNAKTKKEQQAAASAGENNEKVENQTSSSEKKGDEPSPDKKAELNASKKSDTQINQPANQEN